MRRLSYFWKDTGSGGGGCPALYGAPGPDGTPGYVVQGKRPSMKTDDRPGFYVYGAPVTDPADLAQLRDLTPDEEAVWIPASELDLAAIDDSTEFQTPRSGQVAVWVPANVLDLSRTPARA